MAEARTHIDADAKEAAADDAVMAKAAEVAYVLGREDEIQELLEEVLERERIERQVKGSEDEKKERSYRKRLQKAGYECAPGCSASNMHLPRQVPLSASRLTLWSRSSAQTTSRRSSK